MTSISTAYEIMTSPLADPLRLRRLELNDYKKGFLELLGELSTVGNVSEKEFQDRLDFITLKGHVVYVIENEEKHKIVAAATLIVEPKFIHGCSNVGHIEDVVVTEAARGQHLGLKIVAACVTKALESGCYKVILDCKVDRVGFYEKVGFEVKDQQMALYFHK